MGLDEVGSRFRQLHGKTLNERQVVDDLTSKLINLQLDGIGVLVGGVVLQSDEVGFIGHGGAIGFFQV